MLRLTTLGAIDLRDRLGHPVRDVLAQPKRVALLAYLAVESRRGPVARDSVLALFWPESDAAHARNALAQALHRLRQALGADVIESHGANALSVASEQLWCDATAFVDALERGEVELALDLYRGEFCPALFGRAAPELEQWLDTQRRDLRGRALAAARALAERRAASGDGPGTSRAARRALAMQPDDEGDVRALLTLLEGAGDRAGALLAYQEYAQRLAAQLETEPGPETRRLVDAMRRRRDEVGPASSDQAAAVADAPPAEPPAAVLPPPPVARSWRRPLVFTGLTLALVAVAGMLATRMYGRPAVAQPVRTLAVFPFTLRGGAPSGYLRDGMVDLMSAKLEGASGFHAIDPRSVLSAVAGQENGAAPDPDEDTRIARQLGAGWYIRGDVIEVAGRLQINGTLVDLGAGSQPIATASVSGDTAALFELVDDLAGRMLARLSRGRDTTLTQLAAVTTHSLPALRRYLDGERALRAGRDAQAAAAFREAATLDTSFALAQYRLALSATWVNTPDAENPTVWAATAARHAERLTPLARDLLTAYRAYRELRGEEAERLYRSSTESHPDNVEAWFMLGEVLFHYNPYRGRSPMEAWTPFQRVLTLDPGNAHAMVHLARLAAMDGRTAALDSLVQAYRDRHPDAERMLEMQGLQAFVRNDREGRRQVTASARTADDYVLISLQQAAILFAQNFDAARDLIPSFSQSAGTSLNRFLGWRYIAELGLAGGQWGKAGEAAVHAPDSRDADDWLLEGKALLAVEPLLPLPPARLTALRDTIAARHPYRAPAAPTIPSRTDLGPQMQAYLLGMLSARLGDTAAARRYLDELAAVRDEPRAGPARDLAHGLRAEMARGRGDFKGALAEVERFQFTVSSAGVLEVSHWGLHERFLRAELLHALGRDDEALPWYESFHGGYDLPYLAPAQFRLAEICARQGDRKRAAFHASRVLAMWRTADPELQPLLAQARAWAE
jgi:DNA-binding SARP family transcriptional activator/TolB-like protein